MLKRLVLIMTLLCGCLACGQSLTTYTGTIKDLSGAVVTAGQVTFTLQPGLDSTISGVARFVPSTITCNINGSGNIVSLSGGSCQVVQNTSLNPAGTSYQICIQPNFISPGSCFNDYAATSTKDITTVVPTPTTSPAFSFVDLFSTQTISGNKTFTGTTTFSGPMSGTITAATLNGILWIDGVVNTTMGGTYALLP